MLSGSTALRLTTSVALSQASSWTHCGDTPPAAGGVRSGASARGRILGSTMTATRWSETRCRNSSPPLAP